MSLRVVEGAMEGPPRIEEAPLEEKRSWKEEVVPPHGVRLPLQSRSRASFRGIISAAHQLIEEGGDLTLISYGAMMRPTLEAAAELKNKDGIAAEVIDLLTISPLDEEILVQSAKKTGRVVVVHEAPRSFGPGAEVVSRLMEKAFYYLEAPIERVTGFDIVIPLFSREKAYLPGTARICRAAKKILAAA